MTPTRATPLLVLWFRTVQILVLLGISLAPRPARSDSSLLPQSALLPSPNPLCDSNLVPCLNIDKFAGHAYVDLMVLPGTELREAAVVVPYGVTVGLFGRFAGSIASHTAFWGQGGSLQNQQGPLRLSLTALLWPLLPLSQAPAAGQAKDGTTHFVPPRRLRIGLTFEQQWRVGPLDGPNSLGFLQDLAELRLVAVRAFGPVKITASLGALYDWRGTFATGEAAAQVGVYLPFFPAMKIYGEALGRGTPTFVRNGTILPLVDGLDAIHPQAVLGGGLSFRPSERVDLGVSIQRGIGGLAPVAVLVRFLTLSLGETYEHRAATPVAQLAADATVAVATVIKDYLARLPIDPKLDEQCLLWDDNGALLFPQPIGIRTADGQNCLVQGELLPIHQSMWRDPKKSVICRDGKLTDCLMYRRPHEHGYRVLHRPWVGEDCVLRERIYDPTAPGLPAGETHRIVALAVLGSLTDDKRGCRDETGYVHRIGTSYYREHNHQWICAAPRIEEQRDTCFLALAELPSQMKNQTTPAGRLIRALDHGAVEEARDLDKVPAQVVATAEGIQSGRITAGTVRDALKDRAFSFAHHFTREGVHETWESLTKFAQRPLIEQGEAGARVAGSSIVGAPVAFSVGVVTDGFGGALLSGTEKATDVVKIGTSGKKAVAAATKVPQKLATVEASMVQKAEEVAAHAAVPKGGTYMLVDVDTSKVMRTGRTKDLKRREKEHARHPDTKHLDMKVDKRTDSYPEQRGREQIIHELYDPSMNKLRPIGDKNPRKQQYLDAAKRLADGKN